MKEKVCIFWFRRDLRLADNAGLQQAHANASGFPVLPIFIFDQNILSRLPTKEDRRVDYIHQALEHLNKELQALGTRLQTFIGQPLAIFQQLAQQFDIVAIYSNRDYEPKCIARDEAIAGWSATQGIGFFQFKDQVIFDRGEVTKPDGSPYTVFTPFAKKWKATLAETPHLACPNPNPAKQMYYYRQEPRQILSLEDIGFYKTDCQFVPPTLDVSLIARYDQTRDFPALQGTTRLGMALRFGTISVRACVSEALETNEIWLNELIWREFFMQILYHFPQVEKQAFKPAYDHIRWRDDEVDFGRWCEGQTGYPLVDAGMRELNATGFMHNRVRMVAASFLCKHLLIDWRWGEAYFAEKLNDFDLAANNGNWQWAAGSGCDAAPYFRIFNPITQAQRFDKHGEYIRTWVPEMGTSAYVEPIVEHAFARERALAAYREALSDR